MSYFKERNIHIEPHIEHQELPDMTGKVVVVNGAGKGIGAEVALMCEGLGATVWTTSRTGDTTVWADMVNPKTVETVFKTVGNADFVLNNVGMYHKGTIEDTSYEEWRQVMDYNLDSMFVATKEAAKILNPGGVIVNMSSRPTLENYAGWSAYTVSKVGGIIITQAIADERPDIKAYAICPSRVDTDFRQRLFPDEDVATRLSPADVANVIGFLFSGKEPSGSYYWIKQSY